MTESKKVTVLLTQQHTPLRRKSVIPVPYKSYQKYPSDYSKKCLSTILRPLFFFALSVAQPDTQLEFPYPYYWADFQLTGGQLKTPGAVQLTGCIYRNAQLNVAIAPETSPRSVLVQFVQVLSAITTWLMGQYRGQSRHHQTLYSPSCSASLKRF